MDEPGGKQSDDPDVAEDSVPLQEITVEATEQGDVADDATLPPAYENTANDERVLASIEVLSYLELKVDMNIRWTDFDAQRGELHFEPAPPDQHVDMQVLLRDQDNVLGPAISVARDVNKPCHLHIATTELVVVDGLSKMDIVRTPRSPPPIPPSRQLGL